MKTSPQSSLVLTGDQAGGAGPGAGGQKEKKNRLIADYFVIGLSSGDQEIIVKLLFIVYFVSCR